MRLLTLPLLTYTNIPCTACVHNYKITTPTPEHLPQTRGVAISQENGPWHRAPGGYGIIPSSSFRALPRSHWRIRPWGVPSVTKATWGYFEVPRQPTNHKRASDNVNSLSHTACDAGSNRECRVLAMSSCVASSTN
ncbi:hypothetical protein BKA58DRAFT_83647 [Alternaria rosae]|uniref:uncharacterized protein n=1 Tax=Alternaria rosae TaxID=1187941 RepID=UPI001E8D38D9|nr:uncharacterized protein BKA58DRAFT_83647 [Alternaria rosae]KAH6877833.1 hypothetical protein BKA58DRAFT_83647 [Alternaria rosae]